MTAPLEPEAARHPPPGAVRDEELGAWVLCETNEQGERHGDCGVYRDDGSLAARCRYEAGLRSGTFSTYHPNGELASEGRYQAGALDGTVTRYASDARGAEPLRACCVPPGARELRAVYRHGLRLRETFLDAAGRALLSDGRLMPERAPGVPEEAEFNEFEGRWIQRELRTEGSELRRCFSLSGTLAEETEISGGKTVLEKRFGGAGLASVQRFDEYRRLHGECLERHAVDSPFADSRIHEVIGSFAHGQSSGVFRYLDARGGELFRRDRGEPISAESFRALTSSPELDEPPGAAFSRVDELLARKRLREALFVAACAAGRSRDASHLEALLASTTVPLRPELAGERTEALEGVSDLQVEQIFEALVSGAEPSGLWRLLATMTPVTSPRARELVEASLLLAKDPNRPLVTRALMRLEQGDVAGALDDASSLGADYETAVEHVRATARVLFKKPLFAPLREPPPATAPELEKLGIEQPLEAVRWGVRLYATRLTRAREVIRRRLGETPEFLPPDLAALLAGEETELRRCSATILDEDGGEVATSDVEIDETFEPAACSVKRLLAIARADLDALSWLCWSAGLDELGVPERLDERPEFAAAVNQAMMRCWRAHDQIRTGGLVSRARGVRSFEWEGAPLETATRSLLEIAAAQYLERRAMFFWLLFPQNLSPFQSDLRRI